jgi:hypothetical protein
LPGSNYLFPRRDLIEKRIDQRLGGELTGGDLFGGFLDTEGANIGHGLPPFDPGRRGA